MTPLLCSIRGLTRTIWVCLLAQPLVCEGQYFIVSGIGGDTCSWGQTVSYSYTNYTYGNHGYGYRIYRNGVETFDISQYASGPLLVRDMDVLNDSILFVQVGSGTLVRWSMNNGYDWSTYAPYGGYVDYEERDMYFLNAQVGYVLWNPNTIEGGLRVNRLTPGSSITIHSEQLSATAAPIWLYDTIPTFDHCTEVDTLVFHLQVNGMPSRDLNIVLHSLPVGVTEVHGYSQLILAPNPSSDRFFVKGRDLHGSSFVLRAMDGTILKTGTFNSPDPQISVTDLAGGMYVLTVLDRTTRSHATIVVD